MVSTQNKQMAQFFASITERMSGTGLDLATIRDAYENLHLAAREPEGVCYAEVDIDGVPALWCVPTDCDMNRVLLHAHGGGTVIFSMHLDRKAVGHIAKAAGARALVLDYRRSPEHKFPAQIEDMERAYHWLVAQRNTEDVVIPLLLTMPRKHRCELNKVCPNQATNIRPHDLTR